MRRILTSKFACVCCLISCLISSVSAFGAESPQPSPSPSDQYCAHLQGLEAKAYRESETQSPLSQFMNFMNEFIRKVSLEKIEAEAISNKMSFEAFQKWAKDDKGIEVSPHYKGKYLKRYIAEVCGTIEGSLNFGAQTPSTKQYSAEKLFNPEGHAYFDEVTKDKEPVLQTPKGDQ